MLNYLLIHVLIFSKVKFEPMFDACS